MIFTALSFYGLFTPYFLYEEVMPVRLYLNLNIFFNCKYECEYKQFFI